MCLYVLESHVKKPIDVMMCIKELSYTKKQGWFTPFRCVSVPIGNGWFEAKNPEKRTVEFRKYSDIYDGYLHAYKKYSGNHRKTHTTVYLPNRSKSYVQFLAYAFDVVAIGDYNDFVCRKLYIPAFDLTPEVTKQWLDSKKIVLPV